MDLRDFWVGQHLGDQSLWIAAVVSSRGGVDPAARVIGPKDLRATSPSDGVSVTVVVAVAGSSVGEDRADLAVGARGDRRFVPEQDERLAGLGVTQATAQRLTASCRHWF